MTDFVTGRLLAGDPAVFERALEKWRRQPVDWDLMNGDAFAPRRTQTTIGAPVTVTGPGTFFGKSTRTIRFEPTDMEGWWFDRVDLPDTLPVRVSIRNVWTTGNVVSNIVLRSGSPHNYVRMAEHIIALRPGLNIDNLMIRIDSGDPPIFNRGSLDLVEAIESAGIREVERPGAFFTVREPIGLCSSGGGFLVVHPAAADRPRLELDCAVDFKTAIRKQRIRFPVTREFFRYGAEARTNTTAVKMLYCRTIGKLFADVRNLGYTAENILIAGRLGYYNEPKLFHEGKSLEAAWHRASLDLLAALALIEDGQFVGSVTSYKAGHSLDVELVRLLYRHKLLTRLQ